MYVQNKKQLILCHVCNGEGNTTNSEQRGPMLKVKTSICKNCKGEGREYLVTRITYEPFKQKTL